MSAAGIPLFPKVAIWLRPGGIADRILVYGLEIGRCSVRILIAEDDPTTLLMLEQAARSWQYDVVSARDGHSAWEIMRSADSPPLALLDWMMPAFSGVELCRKVREESEAPFIYLVLLTGKVTTQDIVQGMEAGADDYVKKPFDRQELKVRLRAGQRIVELNETLRLHATRDSLTGLWNRRIILDTLARECVRAAREGTPLGVIIADLDHFKRANDSLGHRGGDAVLVEAARRMSRVLRSYDAIGRYGGEEFLIVLPGCDAACTETVAQRMRQGIQERQVETPEGTIRIAASVGAVVGEGPTINADELIRIADAALYRAKRGGRNRVEMASSAPSGSSSTARAMALRDENC
jgi:diguanylate cyclase (GGDEF)-like protein